MVVEGRVRGEASRNVLFYPHTKTSRARTLEEKANVLITAAFVPRTETKAFRIDAAGEYDVAGFVVRGVELAGKREPRKSQVAYVVEAGELSLCYLNGEAFHKLSDQDIEAFGAVDVLAVSIVGSSTAISAGEAIRSLEPHMVLAFVADPKVQNVFAKELGVEGERLTKASFTKKDMPEEGFRILFLDPQ